MPNTNIVGRFSIFGTSDLCHCSIVRVTISSSFAVMSAATVSRILGESVLRRVSKSLRLRYGASINICA